MWGFPPSYYNTGVTVELREIVESGVDIWKFDYPVPRSTIEYNGKTCTVDFDKKTFEQKIIDHYYFRQIGQETVGRWLHYFRTRIREIMPYYVQLYEFDAKFRNIEDPLESYNLVEDFERQHSSNGSLTGSTSSEQSSEITGNNTRSASGSDERSREAAGTEDRTREASSSNSKTGDQENVRKFSNTPQGSVSNIDNYLTEATTESGNNSETDTATENTSEDVATSESVSENGTRSEQASETASSTTAGTTSESSEQASEDHGEESYRLTKRGNIGVQPLGGEVENIRNAFINIDQMVINELKDLFIQVY